MPLARHAVPHTVADIFLVDQNLVDDTERPATTVFRGNARGIEPVGQLALRGAVFNELPTYVANDGHFLIGAFCSGYTKRR